jgi:hypothetical protein
LAPFFVYKEEKKDKEEALTELKEIEDTQPNIICVDTPCTERYKIQNGIQTGQFMWVLVEAQFRNEPINPSTESEAENVTATIEYYDVNTMEKVADFEGFWVDTEFRDQSGGYNWKPEVNLKPNDKLWKLHIVLKCTGDTECYPWDLQYLRGNNFIDGRTNRFKIDKDQILVCVVLRGTRLSRHEQWFLLKNINDITVTDITKTLILKPIEKPVAGMSNCQS